MHPCLTSQTTQFLRESQGTVPAGTVTMRVPKTPVTSTSSHGKQGRGLCRRSWGPRRNPRGSASVHMWTEASERGPTGSMANS